ncbi:MAG TPA: hypothetical protein VFW34_05480 [Candidatus Rubrimentiphilum sp.]|nr:hypothetical protein [Candidatus Rubrimentiphilum sp.]
MRTKTGRAHANPIGRLDWLPGFSRSGSVPSITAQFTPILERLRFDARTGSTVCEERKALRRQRLVRDIPLTRLRNLKLGSLFYLDDKITPYPAQYLEGAPAFYQCPVRIDDSSSWITVDLKSADARLLRAVELHAPAADGIGVFVIRQGGNIVAIPCSEILRSCYAPNTKLLRDFLLSQKQPKTFASPAEFNGFAFSTASSKWYPFRAARNYKRAHLELSQLIPRAVAYAQNNRGALPFLIRTPFRGQATVEGHGYSIRDALGIITFLISDVSFGPSVFIADDRPSETALPFAPFFDERSLGLPNLHESEKMSFWFSGVYDAHNFPWQLRHLFEGNGLSVDAPSRHPKRCCIPFRLKTLGQPDDYVTTLFGTICSLFRPLKADCWHRDY